MLTAKSSNQSSRRIRFVMVGRLCEQKGQDLLLDACARLNADGLQDRYDVWIAGEVEHYAEDGLGKTIQPRVEAEQITSVHFLGFLENPYPLLATADWFLSTSRWEGQSISMQEAAVLGVPLLVTDCAGVRELLGEEDAAGIIMDISVESIYENMKRVILQPDLREAYRQKVLRCAKKIDFDTRLQAIEELFALPT